MRHVLSRLGLLFDSLLMSLILLEGLYRAALFSDLAVFEDLRDPGLYADYFSDDDFWKLRHRFGITKPPKYPQRQVGWLGSFNRDLRHRETDTVGDRRAVLLYGDSFAQCAVDVTCFQQILNQDPEFSRDHYLINYGAGGFGVGQIYRLLSLSLHYFEDPIVIFSVMTLDLDRSVLSVRGGQKPRYAIVDDVLTLVSGPIPRDPAPYLEANPPQIHSYLYRRLLYSELLPEGLADVLTDAQRKTEEKIALNERLLEATLQLLHENDLDYFFVVFHASILEVAEDHEQTSWREVLLRDFLVRNGVSHVWSRDVARADPTVSDRREASYVIPFNGHPTAYFNRLIAEQMKQKVLERSR